MGNFIDERTPHKLNRNELQSKSGYSKRQLDRIFKKYAGVTASSYAKIMQLHKLVIEIKYTTISMHEICSKYDLTQESLKKKLPCIMGVLLMN